MAWLTSINENDRVTISNTYFFEEQPHPLNPDWTLTRKVQERVSEYRGLTRAYANEVAQNPVSSGNYTKTYSYSPIGGGGHTLTMTERWIIGSWSKLTPGSGGDVN